MSDAGGDVLDSEGAGQAAVRGAVLRTGGYIVGSVVSLVSAAVLFHHLGVRDGGRYITVQSLVVLAGGVSDLGITVIGTREFAVLEGQARDAMLRDLLGLRIVVTVVGMAGAIAFAAIAGYTSAQVIGTVISSLAMLLTALQHQLGIGLVAQLRQGWVSAADVARQVVTAVVVVGIALAGGGLLSLFWANVVGCAVAVAVIVAVVRTTIPLRPGFDLRRWRTLLADTAAYSAATAISAVYFRLAIVLVSLMTSATQTGYYAAAFRGVEVTLGVPALLVGAAFPIFARAARDDRERLAYAVGKLSDVLLVVGAAIALGLGLGAGFVITAVAGDAFAPAADVLRIQGIGLFFSFAGAGVGYAALSMGQYRGVLVASVVALVCCAVLVPALTVADDAIGAAIATTISEAVLAAMLARAMIAGGVRLRLDGPGLARSALAVLVGLAPALVPELSDFVRAALGLAIFAVALVVLRALPLELREQMRLPGYLGR